MLAILTYATLTFVPMARLPSLAIRGSPRVLAMATADDSAAASSPAEGVDKEVYARHTASLCTSELPTHPRRGLFVSAPRWAPRGGNFWG